MRCSAAAFLLIFVAVCFAASERSWAEDTSLHGAIWRPESSIRKPQPLIAGLEGHAHAFTNIAVFVPDVAIEPPTPAAAPPTANFVETPASIACIYGLVPRSDGCNPNVVRRDVIGGAKAVAIVDAYDAPAIKQDLATFSQRFGLPPPDLDVVFASGSRPDNDKGWEIEICLDVEWVHALAPAAKIYLVEAKTNSYDDLFLAVDKASDLIASAGGGEISLSWGGNEFPTQLSYDPRFNRAGIVYFASTGDVPGVSFPATSPLVVAVGGTTINRDASGNFINETPWTSAGAGPSSAEFIPQYQSSLTAIIGNRRGVADLAAVADPATGVWVYDSTNSSARDNKGWMVVGGTSAAAPIVAAITNNAGRFAASGNDELAFIYSNSNKFTDIQTGTCGPSLGTHGAYNSALGWDFCTGVGTPNGKGGL